MSKKKKARLLESVTEKLELDADGVCGEFELHVTGDRRVTVCGVKSVLRYESDAVCVKCRDFIVNVTGSSFTLNTFDGSCLSITGCVESINLSED